MLRKRKRSHHVQISPCVLFCSLFSLFLFVVGTLFHGRVIKLKVLIHCLIGCLEFKLVLWHTSKFYVRAWCCDFILQSAETFLRKWTWILRLARKRKLIDWILRLFLMNNIICTPICIRLLHIIKILSTYRIWCIILEWHLRCRWSFSLFPLLSNFKWLELGSVSCP